MRLVLVIGVSCLGLLACQPERETEATASPQTEETPLAKVAPQAMSGEQFKKDIERIAQNPSDYIQQKRTRKAEQMAYDYQGFYQGDELVLLRENQNHFEKGQTKRHYLLKGGRLVYFSETGQLMKKPVDRLVIWDNGQVGSALDQTQSPPKALSETETSQIATDLELALGRLSEPATSTAE